jgi:hypothetical protein
MTTLKWLNIGLRALMELGIVLALGYWGYRTGDSVISKLFLSISAPALVFGFWSLMDFRRAGRVAELLRLTQELLITGVAALALYLVGSPGLGSMLALLSLIHHALVYISGATLLKHEIR